MLEVMTNPRNDNIYHKDRNGSHHHGSNNSPGSNSEIEQLCDRAQLNLLQRVPVIAQRDQAEDRLGVAKTALHIIANIWQTQSEACADNSRAATRPEKPAPTTMTS